MSDSKIGTIGWIDLTVDDAEGIRDFYSAVAGWKPDPVSMGDYDDFSMLAENGEAVTGVCHRRGGNSGIPPQWIVYIVVADLDASISKVEALGGEVILPSSRSEGPRHAIIRDPAGAACALYQP